MPYPGLPIDKKMYLYRSVCLATLHFGIKIMFLSDKLLKKLEYFQGSLMKLYHSKLLEALNTQNYPMQ